MFRKPIKEVSQGDRAALLVQPFKTDDIDRCLITTPNMLKKVTGVVALIEMCKYFKGDVQSKEKFHITIGHSNIMADVYLFVAQQAETGFLGQTPENDNFAKLPTGDKTIRFDSSKEYKFVHQIDKDKAKVGTEDVTWADVSQSKQQVLVYLHFQKPIFVLPNSFYIGSRLDFQADSKLCRIAFSGRTIHDFNETDTAPNGLGLKLLSEKRKFGVVEKKFDDYTLIIKEMFKKETNIGLFLGKEVMFEGRPVTGKLTSTFGASGKVKVTFASPVDELLKDYLDAKVFIVNKKFQKIKV